MAAGGAVFGTIIEEENVKIAIFEKIYVPFPLELHRYPFIAKVCTRTRARSCVVWPATKESSQRLASAGQPNFQDGAVAVAAGQSEERSVQPITGAQSSARLIVY